MNRLIALSFISVLLLSCGGGSSGDNTVKKIDAVGTDESYIVTFDSFKANLGNNIVMKVKPSDFIMEHMLAFMAEPMKSYYVDLEDGSQVMVYSKEKIPAFKKLKVFGKVDKVSGAGMNGETHTEYYLVAEKWEVLE